MNKKDKGLEIFGGLMLAGMVAVWFIPMPRPVLAKTKRATAAPQAAPAANSTVAIPFQGSVKDDAGATWSVSGTATVTKTEPVPIPPPDGIVFGQVRDSFGTVLTSATAGKVLFLNGSGYPMTNDVPPISPSSLRLTLAGETMGVTAWTHTSIQWGVPNTLSDRLTAPLSGKFSIYRQIAGNWTLLSTGGAFTITPSHP